MASFEDQPHAHGRGRVGEEAAVAWLRTQGYRIEARNVRTPAGEIDIVAADAGTRCFIEVKARASQAYGPAIGAVPRAKQRRLARAAALYLARNPDPRPCRFDVLAMDREGQGWHYTLVRDAFPVPSSL